MYYDTTLGKVQCYESDGWGNCASAPDTFVTLSPEYSNAVTNGTGIGTMSSDFCSDALNINDGSSAQPTVCGTNETSNFYKWTSSQVTDQMKSIYVTYQLPSTFSNFATGATSLTGRTDSNDAGVQYQIFRSSNGTGMVNCGSAIGVSTGTPATWQKVAATGESDPASCGFLPGESIVIKIDMQSKNNGNAYVGDLNLVFTNVN